MNETLPPPQKRPIYFWTLVVIFILGTPILILWSIGYRPSGLLDWNYGGAIFTYAPQSGADIYLDEKLVHTTGIFQRGILLSDITPGEHTIVIAKEGYWPWQKKVTVKSGLVEEAISFLVPRLPKGEVIFPRVDEQIITSGKQPNNLEYINTLALFEKEIATSTPIAGIVATSSQERILLVVSDKMLTAVRNPSKREPPVLFCDISPCRDTIDVFEGVVPLRQVRFFPGREDVAILAIGNGVFAIDIDPREPRNFQPIYKGVAPIFILDGRTLYVKDDTLIVRIEL